MKVIKNNIKQCKKCLYRAYIACSGQEYYCNYSLIMGHSRPCEPSPNCTVFKPYNKKERDVLNKKYGMMWGIRGKEDEE